MTLQALELDVAQLPASAQELIECIGVQATLCLVEVYGGTRLWIPEHYDPAHELVTLLGIVRTKALINGYALSHLMIPRCAAALRLARDATIRSRYAAGATARTLAREYSLTETRVYQIASATVQVNTSQQSLF
jgi:Mor transcription activator family